MNCKPKSWIKNPAALLWCNSVFCVYLTEHSGNGGTQVNVTCIVKLCRPDCSSQCPEQRSSTSRDCGHTPWGSPAGEETFLSKEENALNKETEIHIAVENEDNLLQDLLPEEKKVPLGIQDAGMKTS